MTERQSPYPRVPLGVDRKSVRLSAEEMHLAYLHRSETGEPIQSWIRRLVREQWASSRLALIDNGGETTTSTK